jgi:hypothetical protein
MPLALALYHCCQNVLCVHLQPLQNNQTILLDLFLYRRWLKSVCSAPQAISAADVVKQCSLMCSVLPMLVVCESCFKHSLKVPLRLLPFSIQCFSTSSTPRPRENTFARARTWRWGRIDELHDLTYETVPRSYCPELQMPMAKTQSANSVSKTRADPLYACYGLGVVRLPAKVY